MDPVIKKIVFGTNLAFLGKIWLFYLSFGGMHYKPLAINSNERHRVGRKKDGDRW